MFWFWHRDPSHGGHLLSADAASFRHVAQGADPPFIGFRFCLLRVIPQEAGSTGEGSWRGLKLQGVREGSIDG